MHWTVLRSYLFCFHNIKKTSKIFYCQLFYCTLLICIFKCTPPPQLYSFTSNPRPPNFINSLLPHSTYSNKLHSCSDHHLFQRSSHHSQGGTPSTTHGKLNWLDPIRHPPSEAYTIDPHCCERVRDIKQGFAVRVLHLVWGTEGATLPDAMGHSHR